MKKALIAFVITLTLVLAVGVSALYIIKTKRDDTTHSENAVVLGQWEAIPAAVEAPKDAVGEQEEQQKPEIVIPEEDKEYTQVISTAAEDVVTFGFAGDILFDDNYAAGNSFRVHGNSAEGVIGESLLEKMRGVDVMMVNNEFPYSYGGAPTEGKTYTFRAKPETAAILNNMGVDIVGLANNHAYDYGEQALVDSFAALNNVGVRYIGAGMNIEEASHPMYYITESGMKIAIICATQIERLNNPDTKGATESSPGVFRCLDDTLLLEKIREAKSKDAYVVVFIHWGTESTTEIDYLQRDQSKEIVDAGADVIIGCHPHILQKIDYVNGKPVVYSMGNYIFNSKTLDTCMMILTLHTDGTVNLQMVPAVQSDSTVREAYGEEGIRILSEMSAMSPGINIDSNGYISPR